MRTRCQIVWICVSLVLLMPVTPAFAADDHAAASGGEAHSSPAGQESAEKASADEEAPAVEEPPIWADVPAVELDKQPYILMRALRNVQDQIASGNVEAHERQRHLMRELSQQMRALPLDVWDDVRNVRAAIFFVLSGGDPAVLKLVIGREATPHVERRLLKGALAYGEGRFVDALGMIHKMEARKIDASLGGLVALIQGTMTAKKDPLRALSFFGEARLLSPGTLVEEAALRQEIMILARDGQVEQFDVLASQYARRFPKSLFARNFRQQFFAGVARQNFKRVSEWISRTETELMRVPVPERAGLFLAMAEESLKGGNVGIARFAAAKAQELVGEGTRARQRAMLYEAAAMVASEEFEKGLALLGEVKVARLSLSDREIHQSAMNVAKSVGKWPVVVPEPSDTPPAAVARAQTLLSQVDTLLGGTAQ